jgi:hypothetical protein
MASAEPAPNLTFWPVGYSFERMLTLRSLGVLMMALGKRIRIQSVGRITDLFLLLVILIVVQFVAGCVGAISSVPSHQTPLPTLLSITSTSVPSATAQKTYIATLTATGGTSPYSWSIKYGLLPVGLTLFARRGTISGIPTTSGAFAFTLQVSDSGSPATTTTADFNIPVAAGGAYSVLINWTASPSQTATGYNVYRSMVSGSGYAKINPLPVEGLSYSDPAVVNEQTYYYVTTAVNANGEESAYSGEIRMVIP